MLSEAALTRALVEDLKNKTPEDVYIFLAPSWYVQRLSEVALLLDSIPSDWLNVCWHTTVISLYDGNLIAMSVNVTTWPPSAEAQLINLILPYLC